MAEENPGATPLEELPDLLPFDEGADQDGSRRVDPVPVEQFLYIGQGLTADEFTEYVASYDFGTVPPDFVVLHHTAKPSTLHARFPTGDVWDADEDGLSDDVIKQRRLAKLVGLREWYRTNPKLLWDRGPHLYIDDRYIWLFTPMRNPAIHAKWGNYFHRDGKLHYSIGIEVVGYYEDVRWSPAVERMVGHAVAVLKQRLGTFELRYQYPNGNPGRIIVDDEEVCPHPELLAWGAVSSHRDYNKPQCPGAAISEDYYLGVLNDAWQQLTNPQMRLNRQQDQSDDPPLMGPASGEQAQVVQYINAHLPPDSEYKNDVDMIIGFYWRYAPSVGVDPFWAATQCVLETDGLRSFWAARPRRNPAGLGVAQGSGLSFVSWQVAVQAHIGQLLAFALRDDEADDAQRAMMATNPRHRELAADIRGTAHTLSGLNNRWTNDEQYADKLLAWARAIRG